MSTLSNKILDKINKEQITPISRNEFQLWEYCKWFFLGLFLCIVIICVSVILHILVNNDWDFSNVFGESVIAYTLKTIPYLWLVLSVFFLFITFYEFRSTKNGYKTGSSKILSIFLLTVLILGGALFYVGIGKKIHKAAAHDMPLYKNVMPLREKRWIEAEKGFLGGEVIKVDVDTFTLKDPRGNEWIIESKNLTFQERSLINTGSKVRMYGARTGDKTFLAKIVRNWNETRALHDLPVQEEFKIYVIETREI